MTLHSVVNKLALTAIAAGLVLSVGLSLDQEGRTQTEALDKTTIYTFN